jgi:membrane protein DedA with SNARE-associated domain
MATPPPETSVHDAPHPNVRRLVLASAAVLLAFGTFGSNIGPAWWRTRPLLLLVFSSRNRNLFFTAPAVEWLPWALIGFTRIMVAAVVLFFVGRWYGRRAVIWFEGKVGELPPIYRWFRTAIDKAGWLLVLWMPGNNLVVLMAGHRRMPIPRFLVLAAVGIALKLAVLWWGAELLDRQVETILDWVEDYQWWLVAALFILSFATQGRRAARELPEVVEELEHPHEFAPEPDGDDAPEGREGTTAGPA